MSWHILPHLVIVPGVIVLVGMLLTGAMQASGWLREQFKWELTQFYRALFAEPLALSRAVSRLFEYAIMDPKVARPTYRTTVRYCLCCSVSLTTVLLLSAGPAMNPLKSAFGALHGLIALALGTCASAFTAALALQPILRLIATAAHRYRSGAQSRALPLLGASILLTAILASAHLVAWTTLIQFALAQPSQRFETISIEFPTAAWQGIQVLWSPSAASDLGLWNFGGIPYFSVAHASLWPFLLFAAHLIGVAHTSRVARWFQRLLDSIASVERFPLLALSLVVAVWSVVIALAIDTAMALFRIATS